MKQEVRNFCVRFQKASSKKESVKEKLEAILALMETTKWDADKAMDMLKIEHEDRPTYAAFVKTAVGNTPLAPA